MAVLCGRGVVGSLLSDLDSSTPFRLSDPWRALAPLVSRGPVATGDGGGGRDHFCSGVLEGIAGRPLNHYKASVARFVELFVSTAS